MKILPLAEVKAKLSRLVDQVAKTDDQIVITRNGRPAAGSRRLSLHVSSLTVTPQHRIRTVLDGNDE